jgi:mevalonate kinase
VNLKSLWIIKGEDMNEKLKDIGEGYSHSKLILTGEHGVVYGKPAIAIPFPLKVRCTIRKCSGVIRFESSIYTGNINDMPVKLRGLSAVLKEAVAILNKPFEGLLINIYSDIPIGRGLGSSASIATAIVRSIFSFYGQNLTKEHLFYLVNIGETYAHGNPSGIDMEAVSSEEAIYFRKDKKVEYLKNSKPFYIVVGDSGKIGDTRKAVENVRNRRLKIESYIDEMGKLVEKSKDAFLDGNINLLGELLNSNQEILESIGVSDESLDRLIKAARAKGALGAKLTGGGLGGCIIALSNSLEDAKVISQELINYGGVKSWCFSTMENKLYTFEKMEG